MNRIASEEGITTGFKMSSSAPSAGYHFLPFGGSSYECTPSGLAKLKQFALENAPSWYEYYLKTHYDIGNGDFYIITACHKTAVWKATGYVGRSPPIKFSSSFTVPDVTGPDNTISDTEMEYRSPEVLADVDTFGFLSQGLGEKTLDEVAQRQEFCIMFQSFRVSLNFTTFNNYRVPMSQRWNEVWWKRLPKALRPHVKAWPVHERAVPVRWLLLLSIHGLLTFLF